jgi:hypothetical protein
MPSVDPLTLLLKLPILPFKGLIRVAEVIQEEAERELRDPARARRELEAAQQRRSAGEITDEELSRVEYDVTTRFINAKPADVIAPDDRS